MILYLESIPCGDLMPFIWRQPFWYAKSCPRFPVCLFRSEAGPGGPKEGLEIFPQ